MLDDQKRNYLRIYLIKNFYLKYLVYPIDNDNSIKYFQLIVTIFWMATDNDDDDDDIWLPTSIQVVK